MSSATPPEVALALGRLFRMMSRQAQPGDAEDYFRCRSIVLDASPEPVDNAPNYVRDRNKGAAGD